MMTDPTPSTSTGHHTPDGLWLEGPRRRSLEPWGAVACLALIVSTMACGLALVAVSVDPERWNHDAPASVADAPASPREQVARLTVTNAANLALVPPAYNTPSSGFCTNATTTGVFVVAETATSTADGDGPYCTDSATCPAGAVIPIAGRAWARLALGGPVVLSCRWVDDGGGFAASPRGATASLAAACLLAGGTNCTMVGPVLVPSGASPLAPALSFVGDTNTGFVNSIGDVVNTVTAGQSRFSVTTGAISALLPVHHPVGSVTAPTVTFGALNSDTDTGFYSTGAGLVALATDGVQRWLYQAGTSTTTTSVLPATSDASELGSTFFNWKTLHVGTSILGSVAAKALSIADADGVSVAATGGDVTLSPGSRDWNFRSTRMVGPKIVDATTPIPLQLPTSISLAPGAAPTCDLAAAGSIVYIDDTNDGISALVCICHANAANVYAYRLFDGVTACP